MENRSTTGADGPLDETCKLVTARRRETVASGPGVPLEGLRRIASIEGRAEAFEPPEHRSRARAAIEAIVEGRVELTGQPLSRLARASRSELERRLALTADQGRRLAAAFRLAREVERCRIPLRASMETPDAIARLIGPEARGADRECFWAVYLDARHRLLEWHCVSIGTLTASLVHPREVLGPALRVAAAAFVVAHNHPSGDPEPSLEDREVTGRLRDAGRLVGVPLLDHLVLGSPDYVSFRRRGLLSG